MAGQLITTATAVLKDIYLPLFNNQIATEPCIFLEKIKKEPLRGAGTIKASARYGINGGFGMSSEGAATPAAYAQLYKALSTTAKDMYCNLTISHKTIELVSEDQNAFVNAYQDEVKGAYEAAKWNIGRMLFGNGIGKLGTMTAASLNAATVVALDTVQYVTEGLAVELYDYDDNALVPSSVRRIVYVDRVAKTITLDAALTTDEKGFFCVQGSYNLELTGLNSIFDTTNVTTLYGLTRSANLWVNPSTYDIGHDISSRALYEAVDTTKRFRGVNIDLIMMGGDAFKAWYDYMEETHTAITPDGLIYKSGATGYKMVVGDHMATIVKESFVPTNEAWCVDTKLFKFISTPWKFAEQHTGGAFTLEAGGSNYRGLLASYGDLMCELPGACIKLYNCNNLAVVRVTGLAISPTTKTFTAADQTQQLTATITPTTANDTGVRYYSTNSAVVSVSDTGLVTCVHGSTNADNGTYIIVATSEDGGFVATCTVTVNIA